MKWKESRDHAPRFNEAIWMLKYLQKTIVALLCREWSFMMPSHRASLDILEIETRKA